jgi:trehalose-6-phosphatase
LRIPQAVGLAAARAWLEERGLRHTCEEKPACIAVHWRGLSPRATASLRSEVLGCWSPLAHETGLRMHEFAGGIELCAEGRDKGFAVRTVLAELGPQSVSAYLGGDSAGEDTFRAIKPHGIGVLVRDEFRVSAADLWLQPPHALLAFLTRWHTATLGPASEQPQ